MSSAGSNDVYPIRSALEAQLYLDMLGVPREDRSHRLDVVGDDFVSLYEVSFEGARRTFAFLEPDDPFVQGIGGPEPSRLIGPGQFLAHGEKLAASVPSDPALVDAKLHAAVAARLTLAAECVEEVLKFIPFGEDQVPMRAFKTVTGLRRYKETPGQFHRDRLEAIAGAYHAAAARYGGA